MKPASSLQLVECDKGTICEATFKGGRFVHGSTSGR